jgi:hypothetical protein
MGISKTMGNYWPTDQLCSEIKNFASLIHIEPYTEYKGLGVGSMFMGLTFVFSKSSDAVAFKLAYANQ